MCYPSLFKGRFHNMAAVRAASRFLAAAHGGGEGEEEVVGRQRPAAAASDVAEPLQRFAMCRNHRCVAEHEAHDVDNSDNDLAPRGDALMPWTLDAAEQLAGGARLTHRPRNCARYIFSYKIWLQYVSKSLIPSP